MQYIAINCIWLFVSIMQMQTADVPDLLTALHTNIVSGEIDLVLRVFWWVTRLRSHRMSLQRCQEIIRVETLISIHQFMEEGGNGNTPVRSVPCRLWTLKSRMMIRQRPIVSVGCLKRLVYVDWRKTVIDVRQQYAEWCKNGSKPGFNPSVICLSAEKCLN